MKNAKEFELVDNKVMRESMINEVGVLDKVKDLILLPNTEFATTEQVAEYYEVSDRQIENLIRDNKDELNSDGFGIRKANDFITEMNFGNKVNKMRGKFTVDFGSDVIAFAPRGVNLFPKRAILRVGMLLRDSEVAKEVRTRLLDIIHDTQEQAPEIITNVVTEMTEEQSLVMEKVNAEIAGDYGRVFRDEVYVWIRDDEIKKEDL